MARKDPNDVKIPAGRRPTPSSIAKGPDEDWVHIVPSEPVCRDLSASSCYVALPGVDVEDGSGAVADGEEVEHSVEIDAKEVSPKKSHASHAADVNVVDHAGGNGVEAEHSVEHSVEVDAKKVSLEENSASTTNEHIIPPTRFNLILLQSKSPILHLLSARLADRAEEQKTPDDNDSDVD